MARATSPFETEPPPRCLRSAPARLGAAAARLQHFLAGSEEVFLETGSRLQDLGARAARLLEGSAEAVRAASEGRGHNPAEALARELGRLEQYLEDGRGSSGSAVGQLDRVVRATAGLDGFRGAFQRIVKTLRALGICTSIESSRVNALRAGFDTVADDVRRLSERIETQVGAVLGKAEELRHTAADALARAQSFAAWRRGWSTQTLGAAQGNLAALRALAASAVALTRQADDAGRQLARAVGEVLTALQAHDIARQMIEHVVDGLGELTPGTADPAAGREALAAELGQGCRLQASQLGRARDELAAALERIHGSLAEMAAGVAALAAKAREFAGGAEEGSLLGEIERGIDQAASALREHAAHETQTTASMASVGATVGEMTASVRDIEEIGAEVELIAINALIKSTKTGAEGRTLAVLAQEIQKLSVEARKRTAAVSATLREVAQEARSLCPEAARQGDEEGSASILAGLQKSVGGLGAFHRGLRAGIAALSADSEALGAEVDDLGRRLRAQAAEVEGLAAVEEDLRGLAREAAPLAPAGGGAEWATTAEARYTMESERAVHRTILAGAPGAAPGTPGLGDNVELF